MRIAIDFDGTIVGHLKSYPTSECVPIGFDTGAACVIRALHEGGHQTILHTMRAFNSDKAPLQPALEYMSCQNITPTFIQTTNDQIKWTTSHKPYADVFIDDRNLGCPLRRIMVGDKSSVAFVDWSHVVWELQKIGCLTRDQAFSLDLEINRTINTVIQNLLHIGEEGLQNTRVMYKICFKGTLKQILAEVLENPQERYSLAVELVHGTDKQLLLQYCLPLLSLPNISLSYETKQALLK